MASKNHMKRIWTSVVLALWLGPCVRWVQAADDEPTASTQEQLDKMDKGVDTIDVTNYPAVQQENYKVFAAKCSKCHTLARPINSSYALPDEWKAYVGKMRKKRGAGINEKDGSKIIDFLTYDSSVRKKALITEKLKNKKAKPAKDSSDASSAKSKDEKAQSDAKASDKASNTPPAQTGSTPTKP